ncbi:IS200/IS605 family element transposase accessory protein TnpB [Streptomyces sp. TRM66268-LWL]|uniref:IS200/IS605 family element transposase accessory protein TnpB n=1 Tax=Streptomyces polyasparticus TaxID=2767826 RepID=A0ABR7SR01_9ACTN|nr:zinc ribbon domain-containing protein [Streptomyces polyasparticus]MBC9717012.1 IS200/IS605 family element transposase accessory protein TnpB [Streptomyces polyasparticus]
MKLVVRVKLLPTPVQAKALEATLHACNEAATWAAHVAFDKKARRPLELRKHTYTEIRARWGLGAQAAQHAIKKTCDAYTTLNANLRAGRYGRPGTRRHTRAAGKPVTFRPTAAQPYDDRMLSWQHQARTVSIWTTTGRMKGVAFTGQAEQLAFLAAHRKGESDLVCQDGTWYLIATCDIDEAALNTHPNGFLGVDLGIVNIAVTCDGTRHAGRRINRKRENGKPQRATLHSWPFAQLGAFIAYKAKKAGVPVVYVDPAYTSQECSQCHHTARSNRPSQAVFACRVCGFVEHADLNSSHNIAHRGWYTWVRGAPSTAPELTLTA